MLNKALLKINQYTIFKYYWLIILFPKFMQLFIFMIILMLLFINNKDRIKNFNKIFYLILGYVLIHSFSIIINIFTDQFELKRILAAFNTVAIWFIALGYLLVYLNLSIEIKKISKYCYLNVLVLIILSFISLLLYYIGHLENFSIFGQNMYITEWFQNRETLRMVGLFDYSNLIVLFYMIFFPFSLLYAFNSTSLYKACIYSSLSAIPIILALSRSGYVIVLVASIMSISYLLIKKIDKKVLIKFVIGLIIFICAIFLFTDLFDILINKINSVINGRQGSNYTRKLLYSSSIEKVLEHSPVWGMGIKVMTHTGYLLGSHSTYIGMFYKAGFLGLVLGFSSFLLMNLQLLIAKYKTEHYRIVSFYIIVISAMLLVEDIDGANWLIIFYFTTVGLLYTNIEGSRNSLTNVNSKMMYYISKIKLFLRNNI